MARTIKGFGLSAQFALFAKMRQEAEAAELAQYQTGVTAGTISLDDQISFWRTRQSRYPSDSSAYKEAENQIAQINVAKQYQTFSDMVAAGASKTEIKAAYEQYQASVTPNSDLYYKLGDDITKLSQQIEADSFTADWSSQQEAFKEQTQTREQNIAFLEDRLTHTTDESTKQQIQQYIDDQRGLLSQEQESAADSALEALHDGSLSNETAYLEGLKTDYAQATSAGDIVEMTRRKNQIDQQTNYIQDMKDWQTVASAEVANASGKLSDDRLLQLYKDKKAAADPGRASTYGFHDNIADHYDASIASFIPQMIVNKENAIKREFGKVANSASASPSEISNAASAMINIANKFAADPNFVGYESKIQDMLSNVKSSLMTTEYNTMKSQFNAQAAGPSATLDGLANLEKKYPDNFGELRNSIVDFKSQVINDTKNNLLTKVQNALDSGEGMKDAIAKANRVFENLKTNPQLAGYGTDLLKAETDLSNGVVSRYIQDITNKFNVGKIDSVSALRSVNNLISQFPLVKNSTIKDNLSTLKRNVADQNYNEFKNKIYEQASQNLAKADIAQNLLDNAFSAGQISEEAYKSGSDQLVNYRLSMSQSVIEGAVPKLDEYFKQFIPDLETGKIADTSKLFQLNDFANLQLGNINGENVVDTTNKNVSTNIIQPTVDTSKKQAQQTTPVIKKTEQPVVGTPTTTTKTTTLPDVSTIVNNKIVKGTFSVKGKDKNTLTQQQKLIEESLKQAKAAGKLKKVSKLEKAQSRTNLALQSYQ